MTYITKADLATPRLNEDDVEIPGVGLVRVRALSRLEAATLPETNKADREAHILAMGMITPKMSVTEIKGWQAAAPAGELDPVAQRIGELSKLLETSGTDAYKSDGREAGAGV